MGETRRKQLQVEGTLMHVCGVKKKTNHLFVHQYLVSNQGPTREARKFTNTSSLSQHCSISQHSDNQFRLAGILAFSFLFFFTSFPLSFFVSRHQFSSLSLQFKSTLHRILTRAAINVREAVGKSHN